MMNATDLVAPATVIALSTAAMQMLKYADQNNVFQRFYPITSFIIGLILCLLFHFTLLVTLTTSFAVAGLYDSVKFSVLGK